VRKRLSAGQWSPWFNVGPFCRLVHDEGLTVSLSGAASIPIQFARGSAGQDVAGDLQVASGEGVVVPIDITWNKAAKVKSSRQHAAEVVALTKSLRKANGGKKPKEILFFGAFGGNEPWVNDLKHALGYNTHLPEGFEKSPWLGSHNHFFGADAIRKYAATVPDKSKQRWISFGDEISLGTINFKDPANLTKFRNWLKARGVTAASLGVSPDQATLVQQGDPRLVWFSNLFNEEERFGLFRASTEAAREAFGPQVLTGANYSPHHLALCCCLSFVFLSFF